MVIQLGEEDCRIKTYTIGAADTIISLANRRRSYYIRNTSAGGQIMTIVTSNNIPAVANAGIVLNAGEAIVDSNGEGYKCWSGKIRAIASAAGGTLVIVEVNEETA